MKSFFIRLSLVIGLTATFLVACKKENTDEVIEENTQEQTGNRTLLCGTVTDRNGIPLSGVNITAGSSTATSNNTGYFAFNDFPCGDRCFVHCAKSGYFDGSRGVITQAGDVTLANVVMIESTTNFSVDAGTNQGLLLPGGAGVLLSPNTIAASDGSVYSGNVNVSIVHLDPTASDFAETTPGGDLIGLDLNGETNQLLSYGMIMVEMTDGSGNELNLLPGASANIILPVPASMLGNAPSNIPLWHFNESTGIWIEEGQATLNDNVYYGTVSHFSTWNCDYPGERSTIYGRVLDCNNNPVEGLSVQIGQGAATTNANGYYQRFVPANTSFSVQVDQPALGLVSESINVTSADVGQQLSPADLHVDCPAYVSMDITCNSGGTVIGFATITANGVNVNVPINSSGTVQIAVPPTGASAQLTIIGSISGVIHNVDITLPSAAGQTTYAGSFDICGSGNNQGTLNTHFTINGDGFNNQTFSYMSIPMTAFFTYTPADDATYGFSVGDNMSTTVAFPGAGAGSWNPLDNSDAVVSVMIGNNNWVMEDGNLTVSNWGNVGSVITGSFSGSFFRFNNVDLVYADITNGYFEMVRNPDQQ